MTQIAALLRKPIMRDAEVTKVKRMRKIVINDCFGGFGLSHAAMMRYADLKNLNMIVVQKESSLIPYEYYLNEIHEDNYFWCCQISRDDPELVRVVEELGEAANGFSAELKVVSVPMDVNWHIAEYDGIEHVAEDHRTWR